MKVTDVLKRIVSTLVLVGLLLLVCVWLFGPISRVVSGKGTLNLEAGSLERFDLGDGDSHILVSFSNFNYRKDRENIRNGGYGNTLVIESEKYGITLEWAYQSLQCIGVSEGWKGKTERGLCLGDSIERFKVLYPSATEITSSNDFDQSNKIRTYRFGKATLRFHDNILKGIVVH
jgi:hypothetical protein